MKLATRIYLYATAAATVLVLVAAPATAHATIYSADNKIKFVFGHLNEPVYTYQKTGLDLTISDNATGAPITHLESLDHGVPAPPKIYVTYRQGAEGGPEYNFSTDFRPQFGQAGKYTTPIMFTEPGVYYLKIKGNINGTFYEMTLTPAHGIEQMEEIMWPEKMWPSGGAADTSQLQADVDRLEAKVAALEGEQNQAPGVEAALLILGIIALAGIARRRT